MVLDVVAEMHYNFLVILTVGYQSIILSIIPWAMSLSPYRIQAPHPPLSKSLAATNYDFTFLLQRKEQRKATISYLFYQQYQVQINYK